LPATVDRAIQALLALQTSPQGLTISELGERLGVSTASASRLAQSLRDAGFATRDGRSGNQVLGLKLWELGGYAVARIAVRNVALPVIAAELPKLGMPVTFAIVQPDRVVGVDEIKLVNNLVVTTPNPLGAPYHATSIGKVVLAFSDAELIKRVLAGPMEPYTENTITDPLQLEAQLAQIQHDGFAFNDQEFHYSRYGLAVPIRESDGRPVAALNIMSGDRDLETNQRVISRLKSMASAVSEHLGFIQGQPRGLS
jgi:DNA-binding IclR family transcriptional regulator